MIDIHSHVLYGLDDGARTREDSLAMIRMAAEHGTTDLVASPHANLEYRFDPGLIEERLNDLRAAAGSSLRLHSGCDFHLSFDNIQDALAHPGKYSINRKNFLLVEFSDLLIFRNTPEIFSRLGSAGLIPIVTHPERNSLLRQRVEEISQWVAEGACVQITAQSMVGEFGRRAEEFCRVLLDRGLVHFVASDAHDCQNRPPRLDLAYAWLAERYGENVAQILCVTNPRAALEGDRVELLSTDVASSSPRKWYQFWRA